MHSIAVGNRANNSENNMDPKTIDALAKSFDEIAQLEQDENVEFWYARELQELLGYSRWETFEGVLSRAAQACENSGNISENHFRVVTKMVPVGSGAMRGIEDVQLTRYACYLVAQNGDPRKEVIAFAQSYFAIQTRKQELLEERINLHSRIEARERLRESEKLLSQNIYSRGVSEQGFGRIRSRGDCALFGGNTTQNMKDRYGIKGTRPLADFLPTLTIAAKNLATEMTNYNTQESDLQGETSITKEHVQNNTSVRGMLKERGIVPESLPPAEDIKKLERRVKSQEKLLAKGAKFLCPREED